ncbi:ACP S-malonyltransferase [Nitratireductor sp. B36]|nr:ACP S-malonyltransferase [Nitratireductor sp. B36]
MLVFMFPGQGSQFPGMGKELFDASRIFGALESRIDQIAGFPVRDTCLNADESTLQRTEITQPCLYVVNALTLEQTLAAGRRPDCFIGHSLGEYNALQAAGAFDLLTGLRIVTRRGQLMAEQREGGMMAVIGLDEKAVSRHLEAFPDAEIANVNAPDQIVISGAVAALEEASEGLIEAGAMACIPLAVGAAFHSRFMEPATDALAQFLRDIPFRALRVEVISNVTALPYPKEPDQEIRSLLVRQLASRVLFAPAIARLKARTGVEFIEVGPGKVLTRLVEKIPGRP